MATTKSRVSRWLVPLVLFSATSCFAQQSSEEESRKDLTQVSPSQSPEAARYELIVEHARTNMELAEVELQYALEENRKIPGVIPKLAVERLRSNLAVAKEQYTEASLASVGGPERVRLRHAEEKVRLTKLTLQKGKKLRYDGAINELELKRLELKHDLAKLNLALINHPEKFVTLLYHLEAKLNNLGEEILALDQRISNLEPLR